MAATSEKDSFYGPVDENRQDALLEEYIQYLNQKNGQLDPETGILPQREESLKEMNSSPVRYQGKISQADFDRVYEKLPVSPNDIPPDLLVLLTFCKMNAGEAYGVRVVKAVHGRRDQGRTDLPYRVIQVAQEEEEYHTRILVGAAHYFDINGDGDYRPKLALKVLIHSIAYAPRPLFHPILFASEAAGVYVFNWTLDRVSSFYPGQPELQDALAQRLIAILIDEVGHVSFNRLVMGKAGRSLGKTLAFQTVRGMTTITPELALLGFNRQAEKNFGAFDYHHLPEEVRAQAFYA